MSQAPAPASAGGREPLPTAAPEAPARSSSGHGLSVGRLLSGIPALVPAAIVVAMVVVLLEKSQLELLPGFFSSDWNPSIAHPQYGIGVFVAGSFMTAIPAIALAMAIGLGIGIGGTTYLPRNVSRLLDPFVDLLAGIPSVVYGIWGFVVVGPYLWCRHQPVALFPPPLPSRVWRDPPQASGQGLPLAIFLLTLMALPITTLLIRDALRSVPKDLWESGLALGATRWEVMRRIAIPYSRRGILSAGFLGFGRAFGETVAVAMVIGSVASFPANVFGTTYTMAAVIFQTVDAAQGSSNYLQALAEIALILLAISLVVNIVGRRLITGFSSEQISGL